MIATVLTCTISTILMGVLSDTPLILVPGMGINSLFTYTIVQSMGLAWQEALLDSLSKWYNIHFNSKYKANFNSYELDTK